MTGVVTSIGKPIWATVDGRPPPKPLDCYPLAPGRWRYRVTTLQVRRVLWDSPELTIREEDSVQVWLMGDGTHTGRDAPIPGMKENEMSGPVQVGSEVLWLLRRWSMGLIDPDPKSTGAPYIPVVVFPDGYRANWTLRDGHAVNPDPRRTVPAQALIDRLLREHGRGHVAGDWRGRYNPLEE